MRRPSDYGAVDGFDPSPKQVEEVVQFIKVHAPIGKFHHITKIEMSPFS